MVTAALQSRCVHLWSAVVVISVATTTVALVALAGEQLISRRFDLDSTSIRPRFDPVVTACWIMTVGR
jgi:hypothetical protein